MKYAEQQKSTSIALNHKMNSGISAKPRQTKVKTVRKKRETPEKNNVQSVDNVIPSPSRPPWKDNPGTRFFSPATETTTIREGQSAKVSSKLKLQLFPIDDSTLEGLQKDKYNPYLELTLGTRKKISSVVKHVSAKWANSKIALGKLMLLPYEAQLDNLAAHRRWSVEDTGVSAGDIYVDLGSPAVFRLRYGWFFSVESGDGKGKQSFSASDGRDLVSSHDLLKSCKKKSLPEEGTEKEQARLEKYIDILFPDNLTNISFGDLLAATTITSTSQQNGLPRECGSYLSQFPFCCDSFDAAIASHLACHPTPNQSVQVPNISIWDAEETCHAFSSRKSSSSVKEFVVPTQCCNTSTNDEIFSEKCPDLAKLHNRLESIGRPNNQVETIECGVSKKPVIGLQPHEQDSFCRDSQSQTQVQNGNEGSLGFAGINWDSLAPMDAGMPFKQINHDDSMNFSGLLGNSRDASRSCSFALKTS